MSPFLTTPYMYCLLLYFHDYTILLDVYAILYDDCSDYETLIFAYIVPISYTCLPTYMRNSACGVTTS